ncbi:ABC-2 transporter permease [Alkalicoccobacillus plakortidis]|uniref:ABC-2 transporter permease n=1 Tax=Alkalicoccobacillus plakortidis TaxID=444060 RepID=A0ABT0XQ81_9BACI|nr:ABC-2 transporter permease [Alkalicoccobacillus plakortidis]MCM2678036.1 ABC-2 transporter permease [Alkalicoccobacillus plakortidis]
MKGLILNQYYSVEKSIWGYAILGFILSMVLVFFENPAFQRVAAFFPVAFMASVALEVLQQEAKSGWSKYVLTLPVKRERVVQTHYLFFGMITFLGLLITCITYLLAQLLFGIELSISYVYSLMNILGITFTMGFISYPLTYILGTEKAGVVAMTGFGAGIGLFFLSALIFELLPVKAFQGMNLDLLFSLSFMTINFILFIISYIVSIQVYKRKEF